MSQTTNPFEKIRTKMGDSDKSISWYQSQIKSLSKTSFTPSALLRNSSQLVNQVMPGKMYLFFYEAKLKDKLPHWDKFPLVLPFRRVEGGFLGINLHYLPYALRFKLLGVLHNYASDRTVNENTRVKISWSILDSLSRVAPVDQCVKHYLYDHIQSRFLNINYPDWVTASLLPVEQFVGASKSDVWNYSRK